MEVVRATSQDKLARLSVAQLQELCQQLGLEYEAPRGNAAILLKRHVAALNESHQAEEGEHALDGNSKSTNGRDYTYCFWPRSHT